MRQLVLSLSAVSALAVLAACQNVTPLALSDSPAQPAVQTLAAPTPTGAVTLRVKWPDRTAQYIPDTAETIVFGVYKAGVSTPLATSSLTRPKSDISFQPLPIGSVRFTADALDPDGSVGASGSATVTILANATVSVPLHLVTTVPAPTITGFSPANGVPGQQVTVTGTNFGAARDLPLTVKYGNSTVASDRVFRLSDTQLSFFVPANSSNATFSVTVGNQSVFSTPAFQVIATVSVTPDTVTLDGSHPEETLTVAAKDTANFIVTNPVLTWAMLSQAKTSGGTVDELFAFDKSTGKLTRGTATGTAKLGIGLGATLATVSVTVN